MSQIWKLSLPNLQDLGHYPNQLMPLLESREQRERTIVALCTIAIGYIVRGKCLGKLETTGRHVFSLLWDLYCIVPELAFLCCVLDYSEKKVECLKITPSGSILKGWGWKTGITKYPAEPQTPAFRPHTLQGMIPNAGIICGKSTASRRQGDTGVKSIPTSTRPWYFGWKAEGIWGKQEI